MTDLINWSEFNTLTQCERKYVYQYVLNQEEPGEKRGLHLGTLCHLWHRRWLDGWGATLPLVWKDDIEPGGKPGEGRVFALEDFDPALVTRAEWLAERFSACYGESPPSSWTVISAEEWTTRDFTWGTLVGRTDGFVEIDGRLWLIELKTYGSRPGPLEYAQVSPQLGCYCLLAEAKYGERPFGVLYQGIYTYQWKPKQRTLKDIIAELGTPMSGTKADLVAVAKLIQANEPGLERPAEESFDQIEVELGEDHLRTAEHYLYSAIMRREIVRPVPGEIGDPLRLALPSVGPMCRGCGYKARCWNDLGGVEEDEPEIEIEDDAVEPV